MQYNPTVWEGSSTKLVYVWACATDANRHTHPRNLGICCGRNQQVQTHKGRRCTNLLGVLRSDHKDAGMGTLKPAKKLKELRMLIVAVGCAHYYSSRIQSTYINTYWWHHVKVEEPTFYWCPAENQLFRFQTNFFRCERTSRFNIRSVNQNWHDAPQCERPIWERTAWCNTNEAVGLPVRLSLFFS